jgi:ribulose-phosphate 3-epimerase
MRCPDRCRRRKGVRVKVAPTLMCADLLKVGEEVRLLDEGGVDLFHVDIMDLHYVPNVTLGPDFVKAVRRATKLPLNCHLMVEDPDLLVPVLADAGADIIVPHIEAPYHIDNTLNRIREAGCRPGIALNPATPVAQLEHVLPLVDEVLVMSVNPGFAGQKFIPYVMDKIRHIRQCLDNLGLKAQIMVDGGVTQGLLPKLAEAGTDVAVVGSSSLFFKDVPLKQALADLMTVVRGLS